MRNLLVKSLLILLVLINTAYATADPLPSWNDTATKKAIITFVNEVTREGSLNFVPVAERIATFDNDGTLWSEQPQYFPEIFAIDRLKALAPRHPEWRNNPSFKAVLAGDKKNVPLDIYAAVHAGFTTEEFAQSVKDWAATAKHPRTGRLYTQMAYQPMRELLNYLRANGFKTYIVSGGMSDFMRPWTEAVYGIPPEQVVGSNLKLQYELRDGKPVLVYSQEINFLDDGPGKVIGIEQYIGHRPIAAFGNSDGDLQMLQWTTAGSGLRFALIVHHTDAQREWAYDRTSAYGRLDKALDAARAKGWTVVDMKKDWKVIYVFENK